MKTHRERGKKERVHKDRPAGESGSGKHNVPEGGKAFFQKGPSNGASGRKWVSGSFEKIGVWKRKIGV